MPPLQKPAEVAEIWEAYIGETAWSQALREFDDLGGMVRYWCGIPRSASSIPLTFELHLNGQQLPCNYRLKDIKAAIDTARNA